MLNFDACILSTYAIPIAATQGWRFKDSYIYHFRNRLKLLIITFKQPKS